MVYYRDNFTCDFLSALPPEFSIQVSTNRRLMLSPGTKRASTNLRRSSWAFFVELHSIILLYCFSISHNLVMEPPDTPSVRSEGVFLSAASSCFTS